MSSTPGIWSSFTRFPGSVLRIGLLLAPSVLLAIAALRAEGEAATLFGGGAAVFMVVAAGLMAYSRSPAPAPGLTVLVCYLAALGWLWFCLPKASGDWYLHLMQALLVVAPLALIAGYTLVQSGAVLHRRAFKLADQLRIRRNWPLLSVCRNLPEVKAFRETLQYDAGPALQLLKSPKPEVRVCALAALEFRKLWRPGQAETVLALLRREAVPEVRAAAVGALANSDDRQMVEMVAESLRDPDAAVRRAAADALFWDAEHRWSWVRFGVRRALSEPALRDDGSLLTEGQKLPVEAVHDLTAWAAEKGVLGMRAAHTLAVHYAQLLQERPEITLPQLCHYVQDVHMPPLFRIELAQLLCSSRDLDLRTLEGLLDPVNPAPLRLLAAETLLNAGPHIKAISSLREIAKLPNRELALATADVIQRRLGVDMGLALGQPLPPLNSPRAVDITRRLMSWAACPDHAENALDTTFQPNVPRLATN